MNVDPATKRQWNKMVLNCKFKTFANLLYVLNILLSSLKIMVNKKCKLCKHFSIVVTELN